MDLMKTQKSQKCRRKIFIAFGTLPEAIKMCPLIKELKSRRSVKTVVCFTGQRGEPLDSALKCFGVRPDLELGVNSDGQNPLELSVSIIEKMKETLERERPDAVAVHGDSVTAFVTALCAFYMGIDIAHVEAGLRSHLISSTFLDEYNRRSLSLMAKYHFAPTAYAAANLLSEGIEAQKVTVSGSTAVDALRYTLRENYSHPCISSVKTGEKLIFFTVHRREQYSAEVFNIFRAIKRVASENRDVRIIYPVYPNPDVWQMAYAELSDCEKIYLLPSVSPVDYHNIMSRCNLVLTDFGGVQEEAASLSVPTLALRNFTERQEGIISGGCRLAGTNTEQIYAMVSELLNDEEKLEEMRVAVSPYGDGYASKRIADVLCEKMRAKL